MNLLHEAVVLSEQIFDLAKSQQVEDIVPLASKRQVLLEDYFSKPAISEDIEWVKASIEKIQELDKRSTAFIQNNKKEITENMLSLKKQFNVAKAYSKNQ